MPKHETATVEKADAPRYKMVQSSLEGYIVVNALKPGDKLPTEAELCRKFGWSRATISRALNEMERQGRLMRKQGSGTYVSEPRSARDRFRLLISMRPIDPEDVYYHPLLGGILTAAGEHNVDVAIHKADEVPLPETVAETGVDGVLAICVEQDDVARIQALHEAGVVVVGLALRSRTLTLPLICTDNYGGAREAVRYLIAQGHRRIACVASDGRLSDVSERLLGYHAALSEAGLIPDPAHILLTYGNMLRYPSLLLGWWEALSPAPTAILLHGTVAVSTIALLQNKGVRIPRDVSLIVVDDVPIATHFVTPLTVVKQPTFELGSRGVEKLIQMLRGEDQGGPEVMPTQLILRDSVAACLSDAP